MKSKRLVVTLFLVSALVASGLIGWWVIRSAGFSTWLGRHVVDLTSSYIVPSISFERLEYRSPATITLENVALTSPDGTRVLDAPMLRIALAQRPRRGEPLQIASIDLSGAVIRLVEDSDGSIRGLVPFVRPGAAKDQKTLPEEFQLSNVFRLRELTLRDVAIEYVPISGDPPMRLTGISTDMQIKPITDADGRTWHGIHFRTDGAKAAHIELDANLDLDALVADITQGEIHLAADPKALESLPPRIQQLLKRHDATGELVMGLRGKMPLTSAALGNGQIDLILQDFRMAMGQFVLPIQRMDASARLQDGSVHCELNATLLGGAIDSVIADIALPPKVPGFTANWKLSAISLKQLIRDESENGNKLAGVLSLDGSASGEFADLQQSLTGSGTLSVREGRLVMIPIVSALANTMNVAFGGEPNHRADFDFTIGADGISITDGNIVTSTLAARMTGPITWKGVLDLSVNAGPLEKMQSMLGKVGDIFGSITDRLVTYRVKGTVQSPTVSVNPLGIGQ